jgi:Coenzyme PQQ synthesis protein D (PqqD)
VAKHVGAAFNIPFMSTALPITDDSRFCEPLDAITREMGDRSIVIDAESELYFGLNPTAKRVRELLLMGETIAGAASMLINEFEVDLASALRDVRALAHRLVSLHLLEVEA